MVKVITGFRDKETQIVYVIGDDYEGDRVAELTKAGFLKKEATKKATK